MKSHLAAASLIIGLALLLAPMSGGKAFTQTEVPPPPPDTLDMRECDPWLRNPPGTNPTLQMSSEDDWYTPEDASARAAVASVAPQAAGGPDEYGYRWDDTVPFAWVDATSGADTGLGGATKVIGPVTLPFTFKFYENTYSQIYISKHGYVGFTNINMSRDQSQLPDPRTPNDVIAPYWTPTLVNESGYGGRVYTASGGNAPNRYFVIEWHQVHSGYLPDQNVYTFEVILHENGDIVVQHATITHGSNYYCGYVGIEDAEGLDGLSYGTSCQKYPSNKAVRFSRPAPAVRVQMRPAQQGRFVHAGEDAGFQQRITNTGEYGAETYDLTANSPWPVSFYANNDATPLTDTDGDGVVDTGPIAQGANTTITVNIQTPTGGLIGAHNTAVVTARSSRSTAIQRQATIRTTIPAPFAQAFGDGDYGDQTLYLAQPAEQSSHTVNHYASCLAMALAETPNRDYIYAASISRWHDGDWGYVVHYTLLNRTGQVIRATSHLSEPAGGGLYTYDYPAVAVAPNGRIGLLWQRKLYNPANPSYNYNVYLAILERDGTIITPPTPLTQNPLWGSG